RGGVLDRKRAVDAVTEARQVPGEYLSGIADPGDGARRDAADGHPPVDRVAAERGLLGGGLRDNLELVDLDPAIDMGGLDVPVHRLVEADAAADGGGRAHPSGE